jgi:DNA-directed RNA polymerase subunit beta'
VVAEDVYVPGRGEVLIRQGEAISYEVAREIQSAGFACLRIRSPLSCAARRGVCANCYGVHPATGKLVEVGEAVGLITAQIISESSQELTERIFNICGRGTWRVEQTSYEARASGRIKYDQLNTVKNSEGMIVVMNRNGSVVIVDDRGREVDRYPIAYGTALNFADGTQCEEGDKLAEWDPYSRVILTEVTGHVHWKDLIEGETVHEDTDKDTGLSRNIVMDSTNEKRQPRIEIRNDAGKVLKVYPMPIRANLMVGRDDRIEAGDVLARIPRETRPLRDVPCGLPLLIQLLEAQAPPYSAVMSESAGIVRLSQRHDGGREVTVMAEDGTMRVYQFPRHTHINVSTGDRVRVGEPLTDGPLNHHDILAILGKPYLQQHLLGELRENFSLNGISFDDKHLEIIVREMLCRVQVTDPGDSAWQRGQKVTWQQFSAENQRVLARGGHPAQARPMLIGLQELQRMKIRCPFAPSPDA